MTNTRAITVLKVGISLKVNSGESKSLSDAIDRITEGLENVVELYNESEEDMPLIQFEPQVVETIEKAKKVYGDQIVNKKLNNVVKEMLSWLDLGEEHQDKEKE
ncbi:atypical membrane-integrating protein (Mistic protein) [Alkalihalobacillus sp. CinArs1]|uniref:atypical membrane-integrating protein (Mistic protein) n=1 Tax=Alkalihalobacillus sp. CinArs1 TaxID=2995314 RepID=UPI0022DDB9CE|nr:atypical membrane-integrating protein (Mistic protein) [Alkalihalobacillus sp. CinArs1]